MNHLTTGLLIAFVACLFSLEAAQSTPHPMDYRSGIVAAEVAASMGDSTKEDPLKEDSSAAPSKSVEIAARGERRSVVLEWQAPPRKATTYAIYRAEKASALDRLRQMEPFAEATINEKVDGWTDEEVEEDVEYFYRVEGEEGVSPAVRATPIDGWAPPAPTPTAEKRYQAIHVSWERTDEEIRRYELYRSTSAGKIGKSILTLTTALDGPHEWTDDRVATNVRYFYRLRVRDEAGNWSEFSPQVSQLPGTSWMEEASKE